MNKLTPEQIEKAAAACYTSFFTIDQDWSESLFPNDWRRAVQVAAEHLQFAPDATVALVAPTAKEVTTAMENFKVGYMSYVLTNFVLNRRAALLSPAERVTVTFTGGDAYSVKIAGNSLVDRVVIGKVEADLIADGYRYRLEKEAANGST